MKRIPVAMAQGDPQASVAGLVTSQSVMRLLASTNEPATRAVGAVPNGKPGATWRGLHRLERW